MVCFSLLAQAGALPQSSASRQLAAVACGWCVEAALVNYATGHFLAATMLAAAFRGAVVFVRNQQTG